ncbi:alpha/beta fold hydrolase [Aurantiacibacter gangjinensis]|uniref:Proline iminopeptidase n=1 Tax=Aurantiacibacter gangjinensis TaxID=502682 RepID=A0A0G9MWD5_9SPHN|nr:alpha/beta fold hydrolase [Aurantiacibacter gangjinensis]APE28471.1 Proline iminopeptidase [Aurantiacibacter gangjinensis]KLE33588.1 proline iminopeptidase [Aurantiacibacter gangjinensis]
MRLIAATLALASFGATPAAAQQADELDWSAPEQELRVAVEGGEVWVRVNGDLDAEAEPAIFIHGGPGGTHMGFGNLISLADERAVILYDQLDSGMSDRPEDPANWRVERFVSELEAIRQALGIERWHVVGHSWGAALALEYAAAYPDHTASAVLGGTYISTPHWIMGTNLLIRELPDHVQADLIACETARAPPPAETCSTATAAFYRAYNGRPDRPLPSPQARAYREAYGGRGWNETLYNAMWGPSEFSARGSLVGYDGTPLLSRVDGSRVLFMIGQYDEARIDTVHDFLTLTPGAEFAVVPGGSHAFLSERPLETEAILRGWLSRKDPE